MIEIMANSVQIALAFVTQLRANKLANRDLAGFERWEKEASLDSHLKSPTAIDTLQRSHLRSYLKRERLVENIDDTSDLSGFSKEALQTGVRAEKEHSVVLLGEWFCLSSLEFYLWLSQLDKVVRQTLCFFFNKKEVKVVRLSFGRYSLISEAQILSLYKTYKAQRVLICEFRASLGDLFITEEISKYQGVIKALQEKQVQILDVVMAVPYPGRLLSFKENAWL